jgi:adenylate cyclase
MPVIEFAASEAGAAVRAFATGRLIDACDDARAPVAFSCRSADCGMCRVEVLEGGELLEPPRDDELIVLAQARSLAKHRLACQAVAIAATGLIRVRWVGRAPGEG